MTLHFDLTLFLMSDGKKTTMVIKFPISYYTFIDATKIVSQKNLVFNHLFNLIAWFFCISSSPCPIIRTFRSRS